MTEKGGDSHSLKCMQGIKLKKKKSDSSPIQGSLKFGTRVEWREHGENRGSD